MLTVLYGTTMSLRTAAIVKKKHNTKSKLLPVSKVEISVMRVYVGIA